MLDYCLHLCPTMPQDRSGLPLDSGTVGLVACQVDFLSPNRDIPGLHWRPVFAFPVILAGLVSTPDRCSPCKPKGSAVRSTPDNDWLVFSSAKSRNHSGMREVLVTARLYSLIGLAHAAAPVAWRPQKLQTPRRCPSARLPVSPCSFPHRLATRQGVVNVTGDGHDNVRHLELTKTHICLGS